MNEERAHLQTAEEALSQAYYIVTGNSPKWSNKFGYPEALEDIGDALALLKASLKATERCTSNRLIGALRKATERIAEQRRALHLAAVRCRIWPQGVVFSCVVTLGSGDDSRKCYEAGGYEEVSWDKLATFDAADAVAIVDRVCVKAHEFLGTNVSSLFSATRDRE